MLNQQRGILVAGAVRMATNGTTPAANMPAKSRKILKREVAEA